MTRKAARSLPAVREVKRRRRGEFQGASSATPNPEHSLHQFVVEAWKVIHPPSKPLEDGEYLRRVCAAIERWAKYGTPRKLAINIPPGFTKSLLVNVFLPAWMWGPAQMPWFQTLHVTNAKRLAERDSVQCRDLMLSAWYQSLWGDCFEFATDLNLKSYFANNSRGKRFIGVTCGKITGEHVDAIVVDDLVTVTEAMTPKLPRAKAWTRGELSSRFNDETKARWLVVGQRVSETDIFQTIERGELGSGWGWVILENEAVPCHEADKRFRVVSEWREQKEMDEGPGSGGEVLSAGRLPRSAIADIKKRLGTRGYLLQYQQIARGISSGVMHRDWFPRYTGKPAGATVWTFVDASFGRSIGRDGKTVRDEDRFKRGSRVSISTFATDGRRIWLLEDSTKHRGFNQLLADTRAQMAKWASDFVDVEYAANGASLVDTLRTLYPSKMVYDHHATTSKEANMWAAEPFAESGAILIPAVGNDWETGTPEDYLDEICGFPSSEYNDRCDTLTAATRRLLARGGPGGVSGTQVRNR